MLILYRRKNCQVSVSCALSVYLWVVGALKQIIYGYIKIISKPYKRGVIRLSLAVFVSAYAVLVHIQIQGKLQL